MSTSVLDLGRISFKEAFCAQLKLWEQVVQGEAGNTLILCEHPHTFTLSRKAKLDNVIDKRILKDNSIDYVMGVDRGGEITYHGPGQLVGYLIFDLKGLGRDLGQFLTNIEQVVVDVLIRFGIDARVRKGFRGAWVGEKKIASLGIGVDKWVSMHGFALNVNTDLTFFSKIRPCGLNVRMTSMQECLGRQVGLELVKNELERQILKVFEPVNQKQYSNA